MSLEYTKGDSTMKLSIYVASPLGFSELGRLSYDNFLLPVISRAGFSILDPWVLTNPSLIAYAENAPLGSAQRNRWVEVNKVIGHNNAEAIQKCSIVVAVLDGTDVDSGTAGEIGYASALGKLIIGYRGDFRPSGDNVGSIVNLQVEYFIHKSGGEIVQTLTLLEERLRREKQLRDTISEITKNHT